MRLFFHKARVVAGTKLNEKYRIFECVCSYLLDVNYKTFLIEPPSFSSVSDCHFQSVSTVFTPFLPYQNVRLFVQKSRIMQQ